MRAEILASSSKGNCTALFTQDALILVDCGKSPTWTLSKLGWRLPDAILLTHEHSDHAAAVANFLKRSVDVFMTQGTAQSLGLHARYNLRIITAGTQFETHGVKVLPIPSVHDAAEPVNFIVSDATDRLLYVTDTGTPPEVDGDFTKIFIEANFKTMRLLAADIDRQQKERILHNHLSIEQTEKFLQGYPRAEVHLLHISRRHGDEPALARLQARNEILEGT